MPNAYPTLVHEWFEEVWNRRNAESIDRLLASDAIVHGIMDGNGQELRGPKGFREFQRQFLSAFPNAKVIVVDTVSEGDKLAARCIVRGRHEGDGLGLKATNKETEFSGMCIARVQGGQIVEAWNNFDFLTMHAQLGTLSAVAEGR